MAILTSSRADVEIAALGSQRSERVGDLRPTVSVRLSARGHPCLVLYQCTLLYYSWWTLRLHSQTQSSPKQAMRSMYHRINTTVHSTIVQ